MYASDPPQFDMSSSVLILCYDQAFVWVGTFFCPLLPLLGIVRTFIMFYSEKRSTLKYCKPGAAV
jgi:hypothetical protein